MKRYVSTSSVLTSGEYIEMAQLAQAMGAQVVHDVPPEGFLVYMINLNIRAGVEHFEQLATRKLQGRGYNALIIGTLKGWDELEQWRPYFEVVKKIAHIVFVHSPAQVPYLKEYGIDAVLKPINEDSYQGPDIHQPNTILCTGFLWFEKNPAILLELARLLPEWRITIQEGSQADIKWPELPPNLVVDSRFIPQEEYLAYMAGFEYILIPRHPTSWIYPGRSGLSAVASRRPTILTDVTSNDIIPPRVAIKYPSAWTARELAQLFLERRLPDPVAVKEFLRQIRPTAVWEFMQESINRSRG